MTIAGETQDPTQEGRDRTEDRQERTEVAAEAAEQRHDVVARITDRSLHVAEDVIYAITGLLLVGGALVVAVHAAYKFATSVSDGVISAVESSVSSLLIVFILVELLSAVRTIITERQLVAEPFLVVGILAAIKEMVSLSTFRLHDQSVTDAMVTVGSLAGVVIGLTLAILVLRRSRLAEEASEETPTPE
ncbi:MAG TPA: phosphate-starvation-inducible PsiE family protein [Acidimicrobiales bacterium]|nr:phosphate-starvation-inducible PsiE family protein [Acidimicrobiales bacterium]